MKDAEARSRLDAGVRRMDKIETALRQVARRVGLNVMSTGETSLNSEGDRADRAFCQLREDVATLLKGDVDGRKMGDALLKHLGVRISVNEDGSYTLLPQPIATEDAVDRVIAALPTKPTTEDIRAAVTEAIRLRLGERSEAA